MPTYVWDKFPQGWWVIEKQGRKKIQLIFEADLPLESIPAYEVKTLITRLAVWLSTIIQHAYYKQVIWSLKAELTAT